LADQGLLQTSEYIGLNGSKDVFQPFQRWIGPMHWQLINSNWNFLKRFGKLTEIDIGPMAHNGFKGYFGFDKMPNSSKRYVDVTAGLVLKLLKTNG
jgi:hypothetical protein